MYLQISPFFKTFDDLGLIYLVPEHLKGDIKIWQIVEIPFKDKIEIGLILDIKKSIIVDFDHSKIKPIISIYNSNIFLSGYRTILLAWIATFYITAIHNSHNLFFPKNLTQKIKKNKIDLNIPSNNTSYIFNTNIKLSEKQSETYNKIKQSNNTKCLLYGLTWSWKTEIYIKLIKDMLDEWKQTLFLIPEIILTNQLSEKIQKIFWDNVIIIHSAITDATKSKFWVSINNWDSKIIIWTRSSIFYPYNNLGLIIIDEEHDNSYVSDSSPRYNTIEIAEKITELNKNKLILASGTPSVKSMYKALKWDFNLVTLLEKFNSKKSEILK